MVNPNYRVDLMLVPADQASLTKVQSQLNQWITKGELVKYQTSVTNGGSHILFEICRLKGT